MRVNSFAVPKTSPVIPPKLLVEIATKNSVKVVPIAKIIKPVVPPRIIRGISVIIVVTASFFRFFIISTNGEFEPREADFPILAIKTIENFATISLRKIAKNN